MIIVFRFYSIDIYKDSFLLEYICYSFFYFYEKYYFCRNILILYLLDILYLGYVSVLFLNI